MSIPSWVRIGAKVVCVDSGSLPNCFWLTAPPTKGDIYTIAGFGLIDDLDVPEAHGMPGISLKELDPDWLLLLSRFRPVHTLRSDIRAIKSMVREMPIESRLDRIAELLE